jgi:hypothetical protein
VLRQSRRKSPSLILRGRKTFGVFGLRTSTGLSAFHASAGDLGAVSPIGRRRPTARAGGAEFWADAGKVMLDSLSLITPALHRCCQRVVIDAGLIVSVSDGDVRCLACPTLSASMIDLL